MQLFSNISSFGLLAALGIGMSSAAFAGNSLKRVAVELDPVAPASAVYDGQKHIATSSKWGGLVDFNFGSLSTGPELWTGNFVVKGPSDPTQTYRREDLWPEEQQKLEGLRLRWTVTRWEVPESMRGWYVKAGYSFTSIVSRANRFPATIGAGTTRPGVIPGSSPDTETQVVTDRRHGVVLGAGVRWMFFDQTLTLAVGTSITSNFKRSVGIEGHDPNARADYDDMIEHLPETKMSARPFPEANIALGFTW